MDLSKLKDDLVVEEWVAVAGEAGEKVELPTETGDWTRANEIRAEIYLPPGADGWIVCSLTNQTRTPGLVEDDGYHFNAIVSPRGGNIWEGWREFRFPAECFYTKGIPPRDWSGTKGATLTLPKGGRIRDIRLIQREIVQGPRMTDEALLAALNLDGPGLEAARLAGSVEEKLHQVARHFRTGALDRKLVDIRTPSKSDREEAERVLAGQILGHDWSRGIDWQANPRGYIEWSIVIHYLPYLRPLMNAWWETKDPRFARGVERLVADWMRCNPVPYGVRAGGYAWGHSLVGAIRPFSTTVEAFCVLCACPETEDRAILDMLKSFYEHQDYLLTFQSFPPSNKTIAEGRTITALGCAFPEFREAADWRQEGNRRLLDDLRVQVLPDGASYELTPGYQMAIASWFLEAFEVARKFGHPLDPELETGIRRMYDWLVAIIRPDFSRPSVSDAGSTDSKYGGSIERPGRVLDNPSAIWAGTEAKEGNAPAYTSIALRDSGYFAMRSGWEKDARYLLFEGGPFGRFHQHEDMLSIDVYAFGTPFIVDPGITSYFPNPWTTFYRTTAAHNTVLVDGCGQVRRRQTIPEWVESAREKTVWRSDDRSDVAVATYDAAYDGLDARVSHRRAVMFVRPDYFIVLDELSGEGTHTYEALFHFMPFRILIDSQTKAVRTGRMGAANIEILPITPMGVRLICGQNEPVQGWLALGGQDVPASVAVYKKKAPLPFRTGYVITPFGADRVTADTTAKVTRKGDRWTIRLTKADGGQDRIQMDWASQEGPVLL
ncbi:MAG: alginate lyase family protein [Candidatus Latescibacteria bacterium]|nr:alginate lyase family protein [Candidatus Latescibacterota bacterium]